ncbi:unnamed protein product [Parnassius apollo]|uniref:(apollo) hypothetical protein n=1 Tax=Parnassius apollo TaxID=110799 RepID=A0A8S3XVQ4_PARAO|nr:unnamed protein product [Parnassius apollo]
MAHCNDFYVLLVQLKPFKKLQTCDLCGRCIVLHGSIYAASTQGRHTQGHRQVTSGHCRPYNIYYNKVAVEEEWIERCKIAWSGSKL